MLRNSLSLSSPTLPRQPIQLLFGYAKFWFIYSFTLHEWLCLISTCLAFENRSREDGMKKSCWWKSVVVSQSAWVGSRRSCWRVSSLISYIFELIGLCSVFTQHAIFFGFKGAGLQSLLWVSDHRDIGLSFSHGAQGAVSLTIRASELCCRASSCGAPGTWLPFGTACLMTWCKVHALRSLLRCFFCPITQVL